MEKKYMKRNKLPLLLFIYLIGICCSTACAQQHRENEKRLKNSLQIQRQAVLLNNQQQWIPIKALTGKQIASVNFDLSFQQGFDSLMNKYAQVTPVKFDRYRDSTHLNDLEDDLKFFNTLIIGIGETQAIQGKYLQFIQDLTSHKQVIVVYFGPGKHLSSFDSLNSPLLWVPQESEEAGFVAAQLLFGGMSLGGKLDKNYSAKYQAGQGFSTEKIRLSYTVPEAVGINSDELQQIDQIAAEAIQGKATPGLVVLVAKSGRVIYNKSFGTHTYNGTRADRTDDIFDLASVTKVTATTPSIMRLVEQQKLNLDENVGHYVARARQTPMNNVKVRDVMLHQAGFIPYIPFHNFVKEGDYSRDSSALFPTKVADGYYIKKDFFLDFMWPRMLNSPIKTPGSYVYSDISMYVMQEIAEQITGSPLDQYVLDEFYTPLGMQTAGFLPRNRFAKDRIIPTEDDQVFRKTLLEGYVHDQGAALKGGVAGHAGLFGNANDLAIFYQMMLNQGTYGGERYFSPETVQAFTKRHSDNSRRGLGFDRWDPDLSKKYPSEKASPQTYGHTGYTGIAVWVDPSRELIYVFLSNRVHPGVSEQLGRLNIRPRIQEVINKAIDQLKK